MPVTFDSPTCSVRKLPKLLSSLCDRDNLLLTKSELEVLCQEKFQRLSVSENEAAYLEESTSLQSESPLWYQHRSGRITSSKFHSVRHTSLVSPSISLAKSNLSKSASLLNVPSLQWGIEHESDAHDLYISMMDDCHNNFQFTVSGLHVNPNYPHLGASLDGLVECECCGKGLLEIKCPYKFRDEDPNEIEDESFYLQHTRNSKELCHTHAYYFEVQGQLSICARDCDFVCWTPHGMYVERITRDESFFDDLKPHLDAYFLKVILPILLTGRMEVVFSINNTNSGVSTNSAAKTYCKCGGPEEGKTIACDNSLCPIE